MGFFSRLFGRSKEEVHEEQYREDLNLDPYPGNKLVKFNQNDSSWPGKLAIIISREESTEKQMKEVYKKEVPFFYKTAVQNDEGKFVKLKIPVSHLRISPVTSMELDDFKKSHSSIKLVDAPAGTIVDSKELITQSDVDKWNSLLEEKTHEEEHHSHDE